MEEHAAEDLPRPRHRQRLRDNRADELCLRQPATDPGDRRGQQLLSWRLRSGALQAMTPAERLSAARQHYELAVAAHRQDKLADAGRHYGEVHRIFPEHPGALHGLGLIALREHRYADATGWLGPASKAAPDNPAVRNDLG